MYYLYILRSQSATKSYVGITDNLVRRLNQHNAGKHAYTKRYVPWKIIYCEKHEDRIAARKREIFFKNASGRKWIRYNAFSR